MPAAAVIALTILFGGVTPTAIALGSIQYIPALVQIGSAIYNTSPHSLEINYEASLRLRPGMGPH